MKKISEYFDDAFKVVAGLSIIFLLIGFFDLYFKYLFYGIFITNYINPSEILISSFENIFFTISLTMYLLFICYGFFSIFNEKLLFFEKQLPENNYKTPLFIKALEIFGLFIIPILTVIITYYTDSKEKAFDLFLLMIYYLICLIVFLSLIWVLLKLYIRFHENLKVTYFTNNKTKVSIFLLICILPFMILAKNYGLYFMNSFNKKNNTIIEFTFADNYKLTTNDSLYYLGKTDNFYFIWNKRQNKTAIYPSSEIKKIIQ